MPKRPRTPDYSFPCQHLGQSLDLLASRLIGAYRAPDGVLRLPLGSGDREAFEMSLRGALAALEGSPRWPLLVDVHAAARDLARVLAEGGEGVADIAAVCRFVRLSLLVARAEETLVGVPWPRRRARHDLLAGVPGERRCDVLHLMWVASRTEIGAPFALLRAVALVRGEDEDAVRGPHAAVMAPRFEAGARHLASEILVGALPWPDSVAAAARQIADPETTGPATKDGPSPRVERTMTWDVAARRVDLGHRAARGAAAFRMACKRAAEGTGSEAHLARIWNNRSPLPGGGSRPREADVRAVERLLGS